MASRQLNVLDGIERQLTRGKGAKGKKSRSDNKLSSDANRGGINAETGSASEIAVAQALPCESTASDSVTVSPPTEVPSPLPMAATQADFQQLQTTVGALAEQMNWFVDRLKEDEDSDMTNAGIVDPTASTSSVQPGPAPDETNKVTVLTGLAQFYGESENVAADIDEQLANIVGGLTANKLAEDKLRDKLEAYARPGNCPGLVVARVNPEIWDKLSPGTRSADIKLQRVQNSTVQAMVAVTKAADNLVTLSRSGESLAVADTLSALVDGLALMGNATQELNQRRRDGHREDLNAQYKGLCNNDATGVGLLYGDDLPNRIKSIGETNRLSSKLATQTGGVSPYGYTQRGRGFGYRPQPYATRGRATWSGRFRNAFLERGARHSYRGKSSTQRGQHARTSSARGSYKRKDM